MSGVTRVATAFNTTDAGLLISLLEGHGLTVFAPHFQIHNTYCFAGAALGGIPVCVPVGQAEEARALMDSVALNAVPRPRLGFWRVVMFIVFYKTGVGPTLRGIFRA